MTLPLIDWVALGVFVLIFGAYTWLVESSPWSRHTLSRTMAKARKTWFEQTLSRTLRMPDGLIMGLQQNGAAYFGSASLLGIGAGFTLLSTSSCLEDIPLIGSAEGLAVKALVLMLMFAAAFFQFSWAFRMFGYNAIALGAIPEHPDENLEAAKAAAYRAAALNVVAGQHFNRAVRLFLYAIPVLFWVVGVWAFMIATALLTLVMLRRQFFTVAQLDGLALAWQVQEKR